MHLGAGRHHLHGDLVHHQDPPLQLGSLLVMTCHCVADNIVHNTWVIRRMINKIKILDKTPLFVSILKAVDDNLIKGTSLLSSLVLRLSSVLRLSELLRLSFIYFSGGLSSYFRVSFFKL